MRRTSSPSQEASRPAARQVEPADLIRWRRRHLIDAGFTPTLAHSLAMEVHLDLHAVLELVDRGCPPDLAARILSPVHREVGS